MFRRKNISSKNYHIRVDYGKKVEKCIIEQLRFIGHTIIDSTEDEDKYDKIDGYIMIQQQINPLQIKYRQTGDDILFEVSFMDHASQTMVWDGRDMIGKSSVYACLSNDGLVIWLCHTFQIKAKADALAKQLLTLYLKYNQTSLIDEKGEIKITQDRESGRRKMLFFAKPSMFSFDTICLEKSIWSIMKKKSIETIDSLFENIPESHYIKI